MKNLPKVSIYHLYRSPVPKTKTVSFFALKASPHSWLEHAFSNWTTNSISFQDFPWTILERDNMGAPSSPSGLVFAMLDEIASTLNFTYSVQPPADNSYGFKKQEWVHKIICNPISREKSIVFFVLF